METTQSTPLNLPSSRILRLKDVLRCTGLGKTKIYDMQADGTFPPSIKLGERAVGWLQSEVDAWVQQRLQSRHTDATSASSPTRTAARAATSRASAVGNHLLT